MLRMQNGDLHHPGTDNTTLISLEESKQGIALT